MHQHASVVMYRKHSSKLYRVFYLIELQQHGVTVMTFYVQLLTLLVDLLGFAAHLLLRWKAWEMCCTQVEGMRCKNRNGFHQLDLDTVFRAHTRTDVRSMASFSKMRKYSLEPVHGVLCLFLERCATGWILRLFGHLSSELRSCFWTDLDRANGWVRV